MRQLKITKQVTNRETASLDKYLQEIGKVDLITAEEEVELAQRIKKGDEIALEKLTKANLRFVVSVAKQYQNQGLTLPDLINEGNLGLIKAARRFDETRGFKFISYAVWWIRQSILQALAEQSRIVRLPLNKIGSINKINKMYVEESKRLLPKKNYVGFSITQGNVYRKKEWPIQNIIDLCNKLKEINKIPVFFIEKKNINLKNKISKLIPDAIFPEHESNLSSAALVVCLGKRLDFAISIDNGVMHMLSLAKIPMIVLFGPTSSEKFAPNYKDLIILDSKKIKKTSDISSINVEDVLRAIMQHSSFLY